MRWTLLQDRRYRIVWLAGAFFSVNLWLEMLAIGVFVFEVTGSPFQVAMMLCLRMIPLALFGALVGAVAERFSKSRMLLVGLSAMAVCSVILGVLVVTGAIEVWHLGIGSFLSGMLWTLDLSARRMLVGDIAGASRVGMGMSLEVVTSNATRVIGPLLGGLLLALIGLDGAFFLGAGLYLAASLALIRLPREQPVAQVHKPRLLSSLYQGLVHIGENRSLSAVLVVALVFNLWGFPFLSMVPVIGRDVLGLGAMSVGLLAATEGLGALLGGLLIASLAPMYHFRRIYLFGLGLFLCMVLIFAQSTWAMLSALILFIGGLGAAGYSSMQSTLTYLNSPGELRARMMGAMSVCIGIAPIGFLHIGFLADWVGVTKAVTIMAVEGLIVLVLVYLKWPLLADSQRPPDRAVGP